MLSTDSIWNRAGESGDEITANQYNAVIGATLLWGFGVNYVMVTQVPAEKFLSISPMMFLIGYFVSVFAGIAMFQKSDNPVVSFAGYNLVVAPLGMVIARTVPFYDPLVVAQALQTTAGIVLIMTALATMKPRFFLGLGRTLFIAFIATFICEIGFMLFTGRVPGIFDAAFVLIFSGYLGYDWARAQHLPKTVDNAIDCAAALYMDIVILFLNLLRLFSDRR